MRLRVQDLSRSHSKFKATLSKLGKYYLKKYKREFSSKHLLSEEPGPRLNPRICFFNEPLLGTETEHQDPEREMLQQHMSSHKGRVAGEPGRRTWKAKAWP